MLRALAPLLLLLAIASPTQAHLGCLISVYADEVGTSTAPVLHRNSGEGFATLDVYYILFTEDFTNAVAWNRELSGFGDGSQIFSIGLSWSDYGTFLDSQPQGYRFGLGGCIIGFGGRPIALLHETFLYNDPSLNFLPGTITVTANVLEHATHPIYNTCANIKVPCDGGSIFVQMVVPVEGESWGAVKALFR